MWRALGLFLGFQLLAGLCSGVTVTQKEKFIAIQNGSKARIPWKPNHCSQGQGGRCTGPSGTAAASVSVGTWRQITNGSSLLSPELCKTQCKGMSLLSETEMGMHILWYMDICFMVANAQVLGSTKPESDVIEGTPSLAHM
ncbi:unnamed protein product [Lepidochelys kempii]